MRLRHLGWAQVWIVHLHSGSGLGQGKGLVGRSSRSWRVPIELILGEATLV